MIVRKTPGKELRVFASELEVRGSGDGRELVGLACPYNVPTQIHDQFGSFTETFRQHTFTRSIEERGTKGKVKLLQGHQSQVFALGILNPWETADGLFIRSHLPKTQAADDALALIREGVIGGLSVGMRVVGQSWSRDYSERDVTEAVLLEVSLVNEPAYETAGVTSVRSATPSLLIDRYQHLHSLRK